MKVCLTCGHRFEADDWRCPRCGQSPKLLHGHLAFAPDLAEGNDDFSENQFALLAEVEAENFWFRSRNRLLVWALQRYFAESRSFLEIGCGTGFVLSEIKNKFPQLSVSGGDIFVEGLRCAERRLPGVSLFQMDARHIPFEGEFDVIGAFDVLEHISDDSEVLSQMFKAIKPGGGIMLTVPQHRFLWSYRDEYSCGRAPLELGQ